MSEPGAEASVRGERAQRGGTLRELPGLIIVAFLLALLIKSFLVQAFFIPSSSMESTLQIGDRVLVNKVVYHFREPRRGDVIVFERLNALPEEGNVFRRFFDWVTEGLGFRSDPNKDFIKRVIGLPGDVVDARDGRVRVDGRPIREPYLDPGRMTDDFRGVKVKPGRYFVMGDNRGNSEDSRFIGAISGDQIVGRAFVILWPPPDATWLWDRPELAT